MFRGAFETQDNTSSEYLGKMKGDSRALLDDLVPHCVRRFIWNTAPRKFAVSKFKEWEGDEATARFRDYTHVCVMRKYDGWFVVVYVGADKQVYWQTMSGFLNSRIHGKMKDFIAWVQQMVDAKKLQPNHAFKIEFVMQDAMGVDHLQLVGKKVDEKVYTHKIIVTDFFSPYSGHTESALMAAVERQRVAARKHKTAPLDPADWRRLWNARDGEIDRRMKTIKDLMDANMPADLQSYVFCAEVKRLTECKCPRKLIAKLTESLCHHEIHKEGYILHCSRDTGVYDIFKFKSEYLGGLSVYYSPFADSRKGISKHAGRQFVARQA